jgi:hypothetical protein
VPHRCHDVVVVEGTGDKVPCGCHMKVRLILTTTFDPEIGIKNDYSRWKSLFEHKTMVLLRGDFEIVEEMIQVDIGGHPPVPTGSSCQFLVQHVLLYFFVIVGSTLPGLSESHTHIPGGYWWPPT